MFKKWHSVVFHHHADVVEFLNQQELAIEDVRIVALPRDDPDVDDGFTVFYLQ